MLVLTFIVNIVDMTIIAGVSITAKSTLVKIPEIQRRVWKLIPVRTSCIFDMKIICMLGKP